MEATTNANTAVVLWNADSEKTVKALIASGASVPKGLMKAAPKGYVAGLRADRKAGLRKETSSLVGGFLDRGFKIEALSAIKTLKSGVQTVTLRMATAKPEAAKTVAEIAGEMGMSVAEVLAMLKA
jgi:hypothetical protein